MANVLQNLQNEIPRDGSANAEVANIGLDHQLLILGIDRSGSMDEEKLNLAIREFSAALKNSDSVARAKIEVCVVAYDDSVEIIVPCTPVNQLEIPYITTGGCTHMYEAVDVMSSQAEIRKQQYTDEGTNYFRPWIAILTDGGANDTDNGSYERLVESQLGDHCIVFPMCVFSPISTLSSKENDELRNKLEQELGRLRPDHLVFTPTEDSIRSCFEFLVNSSVKVTTTSRPGDKISLDYDPGKMEVKQIPIVA